MNLVWRGRGTTFESLPCQSRVARQSLSNLIALPNLIQKFDSDAVLLPCFCRTYFLNLVRHGRSTTSELGLTVLSFKEHFAVSIKIFSNCVTTESLPCEQRSLISPRRTSRKRDLGEQPLEIAVSSMRDRRHDVTRHSHVLCRMWFGFLFLNLSCFNIPGICVDLSWPFKGCVPICTKNDERGLQFQILPLNCFQARYT